MPMDFVDWRKKNSRAKLSKEEEELQAAQRYRRRLRGDYIEEAIREAQERGEFSNLEGEGKPLNLDERFTAGDRSLAYSLLKSNGYAPPEVELAKEIDQRKEQLDTKLTRLIHQGRAMRARLIPPFEREKRAYNAAVEKAAVAYEKELRSLNSRILTLNISAPALMHRPLLRVEELVQQFREDCPLFPEGKNSGYSISF
jgi:DnaJ family protein C protein 28